jgi:hypothetical protein
MEIAGIGPLLNQGIDFGLNASGGTVHGGTGILIRLQNGTTITYSPGLPPPFPLSPKKDAGELGTTINCFDQDVDGAGNRRVSDRRFAPKDTPQVPLYGLVDLGADESHEVSVSGYLPSTRIFSRPHSNVVAHTGTLTDNSVPYFFNVAAILTGQGGTYLRPEYNFSADKRLTVTVGTSVLTRKVGSEWYAQVLANPYGGPATGNYTDSIFDTGRGSSAASSRTTLMAVSATQGAKINFHPFPRNLACDLSPTLYHSVQSEPTNYNTTTWYAWWGEWHLTNGIGSFRPYTPNYEDVFHGNPWYHGFNASFAKWDNRFLYSDTSKSLTWAKFGIVNPPLTLPQGGRQNSPKSHLFIDHPTNPTRHALYVFDFSPQQLNTYTVDSYGIAAGEAFLSLGGSEWHGIRYNLELLLPDSGQWVNDGVPQNNLQTFLAVQGTTEGTALFRTGEATTGRVSKSKAIFSGGSMEKRLQDFRREFTKKYRSKR